MMNRIFLFLMIAILVISIHGISEAKSLFHAAEKAASKRILRRGFSLKKMNPNARFGRGVYLANTEKLALKEKPGAKAVVVFKDTPAFRKRIIDTRRISMPQIKRMSGDFDLKGNIHKRTIGPDLGRKIGKAAGKMDRVIAYKPAKGKGINYVIPRKTFQKHPDILKPVKDIQLRRKAIH